MLLGASQLFAQVTATDAFSFATGAPYRVFDFDDVFYFTKDREVLSLKIIRNKALVQKFDAATGNCLKSKHYDGFFPSDFIVESLQEIDGKFYFFYSVAEKKQEKVFAHEIDFRSGEFIGEAREIISSDRELAVVPKIDFTKEKVRNKVVFKPGYGQKTLLLSYRLEPEVGNEKKNFDMIGMCFLGKDLAVISQDRMKMPYSERMMDIFDHAFTKDGKFLTLAKVYHDESGDDRRSKEDLDANYHLELLSATAGSGIKSSRFDNEDKLFTQLVLVENASGNVSGIGLYCQGKDIKYNKGMFNNKSSATYDIDGISFFNVSQNAEFENFSYAVIPPHVVNAYEKEKTQERNAEYQRNGNGPKIQFLNIRQAIAQPDGGIFLGCEQFFQESSGGGMGPSADSYLYNNVLAARVSVSGDLQWAVKIPKHQAGGSGINDKSYKYFFDKGKHYFVYLDNPDNKHLTTKSFPEHFNSNKQDFLTVATISDKDGDARKSYVFDIDGMDFRVEKFAVRRIFPDNAGGFLVEIYKKDKEDILFRVTPR